MLNIDPKMCDTTLRDGRQMPHWYPTVEESVEIAHILNTISVEQIEIFSPHYNPKDKNLAERLYDEGLIDRIIFWHRALKRDLEKTLDMLPEVKAVALSMPTSKVHLKIKIRRTPKEVIETVIETIDYAKDHGLYVSVNAEESTGTELYYLLQFAKAAKDHKADRIRICDTLGRLTPTQTHETIKVIRKVAQIPIEFHAHNDMGLAVANTLAAFEEGAEWASTTIAGIGERAGNASLEQLLIALYKQYGIHKYKIQQLKRACDLVVKAGYDMAINHPVVGSNMFKHESGIHFDGISKSVECYELIRPDEIGVQVNGILDRDVVGETSGRANILAILAYYDKPVDKNDSIVQEMLSEVQRHFLEGRKKAFSAEEVLQLYNNFRKKEAKPYAKKLSV